MIAQPITLENEVLRFSEGDIHTSTVRRFRRLCLTAMLNANLITHKNVLLCKKKTLFNLKIDWTGRFSVK